MLSQLLVLAGVVIGALASYLTTATTERARWKRDLDSRWDDRRAEAYASYAQSVKDIISISDRLAAGQGVTPNHRPLFVTDENLEVLAVAGEKRALAWETVLLLGDTDTVRAARNWHEAVWRLERFARGEMAGEPGDWQEARTEANRTRSLFYESARKDLQVRGGILPGVVDFDARMRRIRGDSAPDKDTPATYSNYM